MQTNIQNFDFNERRDFFENDKFYFNKQKNIDAKNSN